MQTAKYEDEQRALLPRFLQITGRHSEEVTDYPLQGRQMDGVTGLETFAAFSLVEMTE